jgi:AraC family transcriptional regulator of adaptative response / DNA-3-methyladenine glycosylase II
MGLDAFAELKGIGPWTTAMVAMRGYGDPDVFPIGDLVLIKAYKALKTKTDNDQTLKENIESWRPWRSYAANLLWRSVST